MTYKHKPWLDKLTWDMRPGQTVRKQKKTKEFLKRHPKPKNHLQEVIDREVERLTNG